MNSFRLNISGVGYVNSLVFICDIFEWGGMVPAVKVLTAQKECTLE